MLNYIIMYMYIEKFPLICDFQIISSPLRSSLNNKNIWFFFWKKTGYYIFINLSQTCFDVPIIYYRHCYTYTIKNFNINFTYHL